MSASRVGGIAVSHAHPDASVVHGAADSGCVQQCLQLHLVRPVRFAEIDIPLVYARLVLLDPGLAAEGGFRSPQRPRY